MNDQLPWGPLPCGPGSLEQLAPPGPYPLPLIRSQMIFFFSFSVQVENPSSKIPGTEHVVDFRLFQISKCWTFFYIFNIFTSQSTQHDVSTTSNKWRCWCDGCWQQTHAQHCDPTQCHPKSCQKPALVLGRCCCAQSVDAAVGSSAQMGRNSTAPAALATTHHDGTFSSHCGIFNMWQVMSALNTLLDSRISDKWFSTSVLKNVFDHYFYKCVWSKRWMMMVRKHLNNCWWGWR